MNKWIALLRGVNVGGLKRVPMAELKELFEGLGFDGVETYLNSGNVLFNPNGAVQDDLPEPLGKSLRDRFGFDVQVIIRTSDEMAQIILNNPFQAEMMPDRNQPYVTFLSLEPGSERVQKIRDLQSPPDRFIIKGKEVYVTCSNGYGHTKLNNNYFEKKLNVFATTRNWLTVNELYNLSVAGR